MEITLWNVVAYCAFGVTIAGVLWKKHGGALITLGAFVLGFYAWLYLHNPLLASLQGLIVISGIFQIGKVAKLPAGIILGLLATIFSVQLIQLGALSSLSSVCGLFGLLLVVFGLLVFPWTSSFFLMAIGSLFLAVYSYFGGAWVFLGLNVAFFFINAHAVFWRRDPVSLEAKTSID